MSKLYLILIFIHLYFFSTSQSLQIESLREVYQYFLFKSSELNFRHINDSTAIYTELNNEKSNLFYAVKKEMSGLRQESLTLFQIKKLQTLF